MISHQEPGFDAHSVQRCSAPNTSSQNSSLPTPLSPARVISNRLRKSKSRKMSSSTRNRGNIEESLTEKDGKSKPLPDEYLVDLEIVQIHRRPYFQTQDSRELVEVRPRGLRDDGPTLLAFRALSGHIMIDWRAKSNYKAAERIKELMPLASLQGPRHDQLHEPAPAHTQSSTITAQHPRDVTLLVANGIVYKVSDA
ncbi:uncharacterized protein LOC121412581 [Lytechinus variegatus]|uniref:uncharacterized protein LOC121412581 n=1 Tax=Lytechinus variegatus TaxID=7654 RepID=UPI001BB290DC|nr:uncharacterized protein LOC121412581 [Lytechinus variegatus]